MFTGLIQSVGQLAALEARGGDLRFLVNAGGLDMAATRAGDSIAVNGVCLTALDLRPEGFAADVSRETLSKTTLGALRVGEALNLEKSLTLATPLGGHFVSGHVDGVGAVIRIEPDARSQRWVFRAPAELLRYIAGKGSIAVDGVSLTVNELYPDGFGVNLIPHTLAHTRFAGLGIGAAVNLEVDLIARHVERLLTARGGA